MGPQSTGLPSAVPVDFTALLLPPEKTEASSVSSFQSEMHSLLANHPTEEKHNVKDSQDSSKDAPATNTGIIVPTPFPDNKVPPPPLHFAFAPHGPSAADIRPADASTNAQQALPVGLSLPQAPDPLSPDTAVSAPATAAVDPQPSPADVKGIENTGGSGPKIEGPTVLQKRPSALGLAQTWKFKGTEQDVKRTVPANWASGLLKTKTNSGQKIHTRAAAPGASEAPDPVQTAIAPAGGKEPEQAPREAALPALTAEDVSALTPPSPQSLGPLPLEHKESSTSTNVKEVQPNPEHKPTSRTRASEGRPGPAKSVDDSAPIGIMDNAPNSESLILPQLTPDKPTLRAADKTVEDARAGFPMAAPQAQAVPQVPEKRVLASAKRSVASVDGISSNSPVRNEEGPQRAIPLPVHDTPMQMPKDQGASPEKGIPTAMHSSQMLPAGLNEPGIPNTSTPVGINDAGQDAARKIAPTTLAFGARLDLRGPVDNTTTAAGDPKVSQQNPLPRAQNVPAFAPSGETPANTSPKSGSVLPRAQAPEQVPQRHAPIRWDAVEAPSSQSKDQHLATSLRATPVEPSAPQGNAQVQIPLPPAKSSTVNYNSISANLQAEPGLTPQAASTNSGHDIRVQIPDDRGGATEVRFLETAGEVRVAVRTADSGLAQTLQSGLNELTTRLTSEGIQTEVWRPGSGASSQQDGSSHQSLDPNDSGSGSNGPGDRRRDDSQQDKPRWLQEMEASSGAPRP